MVLLEFAFWYLVSFGIRYLLLWLWQVFSGCLACLLLVLANNMSHCFSVLVPCIPRCLTCVIFCAVGGLLMLFYHEL